MVVYTRLDTSKECTAADVGHAVGYSDASQTATTIKRIVSDSGYAVGYIDTSQAAAIIERFVTDYGYAVGYDSVDASEDEFVRTCFDNRITVVA